MASLGPQSDHDSEQSDDDRYDPYEEYDRRTKEMRLQKLTDSLEGATFTGKNVQGRKETRDTLHNREREKQKEKDRVPVGHKIHPYSTHVIDPNSEDGVSGTLAKMPVRKTSYYSRAEAAKQASKLVPAIASTEEEIRSKDDVSRAIAKMSVRKASYHFPAFEAAKEAAKQAESDVATVDSKTTTGSSHSKQERKPHPIGKTAWR